MKKILILSILSFFSLVNYGQFSVGPKIGYSSSKLLTDFDDVKEGIKHNFQIGAFLRVGKALYLQPEFYYANSGGTLKFEDSQLEEDITFKSMSVPVMVGYKLIKTKIFNIRVMAGPVANFIFDKKIDSDEIIQYPLQESNIKDLAWGMDAGVGVDLFFLSLDCRYEFGLNNLYVPAEGAESQRMNINAFIVSLGIKLF
jgi:hypothetical protein